ncbi:MAG: hypothetical protein QOI83_3445 [Streptomycetaceae bacterium]|nr:hypothetical protein [Streptomycetaceae bacterium]
MDWGVLKSPDGLGLLRPSPSNAGPAPPARRSTATATGCDRFGGKRSRRNGEQPRRRSPAGPRRPRPQRRNRRLQRNGALPACDRPDTAGPPRCGGKRCRRNGGQPQRRGTAVPGGPRPQLQNGRLRRRSVPSGCGRCDAAGPRRGTSRRHSGEQPRRRGPAGPGPPQPVRRPKRTHRWRLRCAARRSYSSRALRAAGRVAVSATGTSHQAWAAGAVGAGSVST